jgi:signal recognition particle GTPase
MYNSKMGSWRSCCATLLLSILSVEYAIGFSFCCDVSGSSLTSSFCRTNQQLGGRPSISRPTKLNMMFDQLSKSISTVVKDFGPKQRITEEGIKPALRSVRRALLDADVNVDVADALIDGVRKRTLGEAVLDGVTADQQFIKAMYDELVDMMGGDTQSTSSIDMMGTQSSAPASTLAVGSPGDPVVVLLAGLQGAGKTRQREIRLKQNHKLLRR